MVFTIWFVGFVSHVLLADGSRRAVIGNPNMKHAAVMLILDNDIIERKNFDGTLVDGIYDFRLEGRALMVETPRGDTRANDSFNANVPPLLELVNIKEIIPEIYGANANPHIKGYVDYRGGCLAVKKVFKEDVTFTPDPPNYPGKHCIASFVQFTTTTTDYVYVVDRAHANAYLKLKGTASIRIKNLPAANSTGHFDEYNWFTNATTIATMKHVPNANCYATSDGTPCSNPDHDPPDRRIAYVYDADCTNTRWP
jgi:hypothetical protein